MKATLAMPTDAAAGTLKGPKPLEQLITEGGLALRHGRAKLAAQTVVPEHEAKAGEMLGALMESCRSVLPEAVHECLAYEPESFLTRFSCERTLWPTRWEVSILAPFCMPVHTVWDRVIEAWHLGDYYPHQGHVYAVPQRNGLGYLYAPELKLALALAREQYSATGPLGRRMIPF